MPAPRSIIGLSLRVPQAPPDPAAAEPVSQAPPASPRSSLSRAVRGGGPLGWHWAGSVTTCSFPCLLRPSTARHQRVKRLKRRISPFHASDKTPPPSGGLRQGSEAGERARGAADSGRRPQALSRCLLCAARKLGQPAGRGACGLRSAVVEVPLVGVGDLTWKLPCCFQSKSACSCEINTFSLRCRPKKVLSLPAEKEAHAGRLRWSESQGPRGFEAGILHPNQGFPPRPGRSGFSAFPSSYIYLSFGDHSFLMLLRNSPLLKQPLSSVDRKFPKSWAGAAYRTCLSLLRCD